MSVTRLVQAKAPGATLLYLVRAGSHAHGTATLPSDVDYRGVLAYPLKRYIGLQKVPAAVREETPDVVINELRVFFGMLRKSALPALESLFVDASDRIYMDPLFCEVFESKDKFLHFGAFHAIMSYANAMRHEFAGSLGGDWRKRGYHAVRGYRMAIELYREGKLVVRRPDAEELIRLRENTSWTEMGDAVKQAHAEARKLGPTSLPEKPDYLDEMLDELCVRIIQRCF